MRASLLFILVILVHNFSFAQSRILTCDAVDNFDRVSQIEFNVDTGSLKMKGAAASSWNDIYSDQLACGLKVNNPKNCTKNIWHNFDEPNAKNKSASYSVRCKVGKRDIVDQNGELEINRFGDGTGSFICGRLSKHELSLANCQTK